jgi:anti-anti-sigma factor
MTTPLRFDTSSHDETLVLFAHGEIDLSNVEQFGQALTDAIAEARTRDAAVTVDLTAVQYLDSGAITKLFAHAEQIRIVANPLLIPVLTISGLPELTTVDTAPPAVAE